MKPPTPQRPPQGRQGACQAHDDPRETTRGVSRDLRVSEIYRSIQGESSFAGLPCTFVRLTGCALRCAWCDSEYTFTGGEWMPLDSVLARVRCLSEKLVEFTGGEPLLQDVVHVAIHALCDEGYQVLVETGGDQDISRIDPRAIAIMDVKCPGSGMQDRMDWGNLARLRPRDELKFVIADRADYEWAQDFVLARACAPAVVHPMERGPIAQDRTVLFSCAFGLLEPRVLADWILEDHLPVRLQLQLHKLLWDPAERAR